MTPRVVQVRAQPIGLEAFKEFGIYARGPDREPDWAAFGSRIEGVSEGTVSSGQTVAQLWNLGDLTFGDEIPFLGFVTYFHQGLQVAQLERHVHESQTWIALSGTSYLVVAPPTRSGQVPDPQAAKAFVIEPGDVMAIGQGVWMCHFFPMLSSADYAVVTARRQPEQDRDLVNFMHTANAVLEIVPA